MWGIILHCSSPVGLGEVTGLIFGHFSGRTQGPDDPDLKTRGSRQTHPPLQYFGHILFLFPTFSQFFGHAVPHSDHSWFFGHLGSEIKNFYYQILKNN
ncbi:hypothetical protein GDO78_018548 [Eleutherodactylus coqui]|uniref:Uncharacterized protein n=1 Tax=Eleutherodactylus coqui TaxID=57060 RepID=A0A8J6E7S0_ELECQ|nr:hypothetical protein GDO78_018548 [Eleutherodactylus coqui]